MQSNFSVRQYIVKQKVSTVYLFQSIIMQTNFSVRQYSVKEKVSTV